MTITEFATQCWRKRTPGDLASLSFACFALSMVTPALKIGYDWPLGYQAAAMACKDTLSLIYGISRDNYVQACAIGTLANVLYVLGWLTWWCPRVRIGWCAVVCGLMLYLLLPLMDSGLLGGVHIGYLLWLASPMLLAGSAIRKHQLKSSTDI